MALYTGRISLGDAVSVGLVSDRADGLFPTMVVDEHNQALGLVYSSKVICLLIHSYRPKGKHCLVCFGTERDLSISQERDMAQRGVIWCHSRIDQDSSRL